MKRREILKWRIAHLIERVIPGQCWADLADWPLGRTRLPWAPIREGCRDSARECGVCYCGKLRSPEGGDPR